MDLTRNDYDDVIIIELRRSLWSILEGESERDER